MKYQHCILLKMTFFMASCLLMEAASAVSYGQVLPNIHHHLSRNRRQTAEENYCLGVTWRAYCSTSYLQNYINTISKCGGRVSIINANEMSCRKSERGLFCGEALAYVNGNCTGTTCTPGCSNSLRLADCCVSGGAIHHSR